MTITLSKSATIGLCVASAALGSALSIATVSAASPAHSDHPSRPAVSMHYLHGAYVLTDGKCPKGTVAVNASVRASTNSRSGHSTFPLCYVK